MRRTSLLLCASALLGFCGSAQAGDRYGAPGASPAAARAPDWRGPLLVWANKSPAVDSAAPAASVQTPDPATILDGAKRAAALPAAPSVAASSAPRAAPSAPLPTSLYDAPKPQASTTEPAPVNSKLDAYHPAKPTGEVVSLSLADLPPPGQSLERQQAAEEDAQVLAAQIARANAQAAQNRANGKAAPATTTELLGGTQ